MSNEAPMPRRSKNALDHVDFAMTVDRVEATENQREQFAGGMRILATWLLRYHQKVVGRPKDRPE
jgi:hypothetical protein